MNHTFVILKKYSFILFALLLTISSCNKVSNSSPNTNNIANNQTPNNPAPILPNILATALNTVSDQWVVSTTKDGGSSWLLPIVPYISTVPNNFITAAAFASPSNVVVVYNQGDNLLPVTSSDGGVTWTPNKTPIAWDLPVIGSRNIVFSSPTHGVIVGLSGSIYKGQNVGTYSYTRDGGLTWSPIQKIPGSIDILAVAFSSANNGVLLGRVTGTVSTLYAATTTDGGETWTQHASSINNYNAMITSIAFSTPSHAVAVGYDNNGDASYYFNSLDGGITWNTAGTFKNGDNITTNTIAFLTADSGLVIGYHASGEAVYMTTSDGGSSWSDTNHIVGWNGIMPICLNLYSANNALIVGFDYKANSFFSKTADGGKTWTVPLPLFNLSNVSNVISANNYSPFNKYK